MSQTLIIVDDPGLIEQFDTCQVVSFANYLSDYPKLKEPKTRLINLCDTEHYLSKGYYCSLLAEARHHQVLPSVRTINEVRELCQDSPLLQLASSQALPELAQGEIVALVVAFGECQKQEWAALGLRLFRQYPMPLMRVTIERNLAGYQLVLDRMGFSELVQEERSWVVEALKRYTGANWPSQSARKQLRWEMAILVNPQESHPPSDDKALKRFIKAASKHNIQARLITPSEIDAIGQYDALFIRETTAIDHHTYRLAAKAERLGLVVIDDASSILRCCNKAYLHDAFSYHKVPAPKTLILAQADEETLQEVEASLGYPLVIKMPEGSFSKGVYKVQSRDELKELLDELFAGTALVLAQEYLFTEFDWRIGVMNGRALYACQYHMARGHWQIYNHSASKKHSSGGFVTLPTFEVPKKVLQVAVKAANMVGQGLYGVDLKQKGDKVYVIEVNDNPSIDHKIEDAYLGDELYMQIMAEFAHRLEQRGR